MQFKSSVSQDDYLKRVSQEEVSVEPTKKHFHDSKAELEKAYEQTDVNHMIEPEYQEEEISDEVKEQDQDTYVEGNKIAVLLDKALDFTDKAKQVLPTKYGKVSVYADELITKHYDGKRKAVRNFVLAVGSAGVFLVFSPFWIKLISGISTAINTYWLFTKYEVVEKDNTADMLNYIQNTESEKVKRR